MVDFVRFINPYIVFPSPTGRHIVAPPGEGNSGVVHTHTRDNNNDVICSVEGPGKR